MELNITELFNTVDAFNYSASCAELGDNAGAITWEAAKRADYTILDSDEKRESFRTFIKSSGGWTEEEILDFTDNDLNALCIQWISGEIRDWEDVAGCDWELWEELCNKGTCSSSLYRGDDNEVYFYIGE